MIISRCDNRWGLERAQVFFYNFVFDFIELKSSCLLLYESIENEKTHNNKFVNFVVLIIFKSDNCFISLRKILKIVFLKNNKYAVVIKILLWFNFLPFYTENKIKPISGFSRYLLIF